MKNWWLFYMDYFGYAGSGKIIYFLRNGKSFVGAAKQGDGIIINEVWGTKDYTPATLPIGEHDTVVDIGAHKGYFTVFASSIAKKGKVFAFEPFPENYQTLLANVKRNRCKNVKAFKMGVAKTKEKKTLYMNVSNAGGMSLVKDWFKNEKKTKSYTISCISLKQVFTLCKVQTIDYLKVDCEGAEYDILLQTPVNVMKHINKIGMEFHQIGKLKASLLISFLKKNGYIVQHTDTKNTIGLIYAERAE